MKVLGIPVVENWITAKTITPPAMILMDGLGRSTVKALKEGQEECPHTHFQCPQGFCIPTYLLNNGVTDCPLGDDENIADLTCPGFFRCWRTGNCLHPDYVCDGVNHCPFNEDEWYCEVEHCPDQCVCEGKAFRCKSVFDYRAHFRIRHLDFAGSNNPELNNIEVLKYLQYLNLSYCNLTEITLGSVNQLRVLDVSHNIINSFELLNFRHLPELQHLDVSSNPLSSLLDPPFSNFLMRAGMTKLRKLVMVGTGLKMITTTGLKGLMLMSALDIRHNPINMLPLDVFGETLRVLYTDNPRLCCTHFHVTQLAECYAPVDELSSCSDLLRSDFLRVLLWILSVMALTGNVGALVYRAFIERQGTSLAYKMLVINLSGADFLMGVYMAMIGVADVVFQGNYVLKEEQWRHSVVCKIAGFLSMLSSEMSAFVICLITLDRLLLLQFPFSSHLHLSKLSAGVVCCTAWITAVVLAALPLFLPQWKFHSQNSICLPLPITRRQFPGHQYAFGIFIVLNFIIFLVIGTGQAIIYHTIHQSSKLLQKDSRKQETAIARRLLLIVFTDFCCWFPIGLMGLLAAQDTRIPDVINVWAAVFVLPLNSAINPFLYTLNILLERRARYREKKLMEKIIGNLYSEIRTWSKDNVSELVRKCVTLGLIEKEEILEMSCPRLATDKI